MRIRMSPMATIILYKDKINGVGSLLDNIIKSSNNLNAQLGTLKSTLQGVDSSTCNLQDNHGFSDILQIGDFWHGIK